MPSVTIDRALLWDTCTVLTRAQSGTDAGGNPTYGWSEGPPHPCQVQPSPRSSETSGPDGHTVTDMRRLWLLPDVALTAGDRVRTAGRTWQVEGPPHVWTGPSGPHHLEATLLAVEDT